MSGLIVPQHSDPLGFHMLPCLNLREALLLSCVNKEFNEMFRYIIGQKSCDIRLMYQTFNDWKMAQRRRRRRINNSWSRRVYNPDDRVIF